MPKRKGILYVRVALRMPYTQRATRRKELIIRLGKLGLFSCATVLILPSLVAAQNPSGPTLKVYSRETIVDVTVTDAKGNPVHGLTKDDFTVKEDGKEQPIKSFEEFGTQVVQPPARSPNVYSNVQPPAASAATNVLWLDFANAAPRLAVACCIPPGNTSAGIDDLARSLGWQHYAKQYAKEYVKKMPAGTRVAIFATWYPRGLHVVQGVTSDPALLTAAIDAVPYDTYATPAIPDVLMEVGPQQERRNDATLKALDQIASDLATIKGRKNLIWCTARISTLPIPQQTQALRIADPLPALQRAYGLLAAAQVTVFPVSITGLEQPDGPSGLLALEAVAEANRRQCLLQL